MHPSSRPRPVADLPCEAMLARADELARRWAIALILARPPERIGDVPLEDLARRAPSLCAQALRAIRSDIELERLIGGGAPTGREDTAAARQLAAVCGASDPAAAVEAVEALRGVLWEALLERLSESSARVVGDISDRLAYVCAAALAVAVRAMPAPAAPTSLDDAHTSGAPTREPAAAARFASRAVIVDERMRSSFDASTSSAGGEIEIRDERCEEGPSAWIGSVGAQLERFKRDRLPFAVLLAELVDVERLRREVPTEEFARLAERVERTLTAALGASRGSLTRERPGRCWLLVPDTDRDEADRLAERLADAVASDSAHRGAPLALVVGTAVCPEDGREAAALAAHADVGLYAARSAARSAPPRLPRTGPAAS
jgi:GGDEF domain-containing protein